MILALERELPALPVYTRKPASAPIDPSGTTRDYATYIFHVGVVVLFQWALLSLVAAPFVKFVLATLLAVPVAFFLGYWLSKPLKL